MKLFHWALIFLFLATGTVSAIQDHPLELGRTTPKWEDVVKNSHVSSSISSPLELQGFDSQTSIGIVFFALPARYQAQITQNGDAITIINKTDQVQRMVFSVVDLKNSLLDNGNTMQVLWDTAIASGKSNQLQNPMLSNRLDNGGYIMTGQVSTQTEIAWEIIRTFDSDGDGKLNYGLTAISTMDAVSAGIIVGSVIINQSSSADTSYKSQLHQEPYVGPTYSTGPNLLDMPTTTNYVINSGSSECNAICTNAGYQGWTGQIQGSTCLCYGSNAASGYSTYSGSSEKSVYVHGYYRKDGTYVQPYYRSAPNR
jgi:hypothetical protein